MIAALRAELIERRGSGWRWAAMLLGPTIAVGVLVSWIVIIDEERTWAWHPAGYTLDAETIMGLVVPFGALLAVVVGIQAARRPYKHRTMQALCTTGIRREWLLAAQALVAWMTVVAATGLAVLVGVLLAAWVNEPESFEAWQERLVSYPEATWTGLGGPTVDEGWPGAVEHALATDVAASWETADGDPATPVRRPVTVADLPAPPMVAIFTAGNFTSMSDEEVAQSVGVRRRTPDLSPGVIVAAIHSDDADATDLLTRSRAPVAEALGVPVTAVGAVDVRMDADSIADVTIVAEPGDSGQSRNQLLNWLDRVSDASTVDLENQLGGRASNRGSLADLAFLRSAIPARVLPQDVLRTAYDTTLEAGDGPTAYRAGERNLLVDLATAFGLYLLPVLFFHGMAAGLRRGVVAIGFILLAVAIVEQFRWSFAARDSFIDATPSRIQAPALAPEAAAAVIVDRAFGLSHTSVSDPFVRMPSLAASSAYLGALTLSMVGLGAWRTLRTDL